MKVQEDELEWKISLNYDVSSGKFILFINDEPFDGMPYLVELTHKSSQNIEYGAIMFNELAVHDGWAQYYYGFIEDKCEEKKISSITEVDQLHCVLIPQTINSLLDDIGYNIDQEQGLKRLAINNEFIN